MSYLVCVDLQGLLLYDRVGLRVLS